MRCSGLNFKIPVWDDKVHVHTIHHKKKDINNKRAAVVRFTLSWHKKATSVNKMLLLAHTARMEQSGHKHATDRHY